MALIVFTSISLSAEGELACEVGAAAAVAVEEEREVETCTQSASCTVAAEGERGGVGAMLTNSGSSENSAGPSVGATAAAVTLIGTPACRVAEGESGGVGTSTNSESDDACLSVLGTAAVATFAAETS